MFFNSGIRGARARDGVGSIASKDQYVQKIEPVPSITSYAIQGSDDQALNPAGGQTVVVTGTGFAAGLTGIVGGTNLASVTVVSPYQATFTSPAAAPGSYTLILSNSTGTAAIYIPGLTYSSIPTYTTAAGSIGTFYETTAVSTQVVATSDSAITYSLASGALPVGSTLYANGVITGTAPVDSSSTTYSFSITATDVELQDVTRSFTLTINTDVVTWSSPGSGTVYTVVGNSPISNVTLSATSAAGYGVTYAANALPTGLTLSSGVISGTPTTEANTTSLLTATASTTNRSATNTIYWVVTLNDQYFKYNSLLMSSTVVTNTFATDLSSNNLDITIVGDTKPSKFDPFELGYYSGYFDGTGDYLTLAANAAFGFGTGDFTVEMWIYPTSTKNTQFLFDTRDNGAASGTRYALALNNTTSMQPIISVGTGTIVTSSQTVAINSWYHIAFSKASGTVRLFINGTQVGSVSSAIDVGASSGPAIGTVGDARGSYDGYFAGYISNLRVVKGTALYTTTFTPSTTPLTAITNTSLLTCQSSRFVDNSANAFAITVNGNTAVNPFQPFTPDSSYATYGSTLFDGTGDRLSINGADPGINLTTNNFTLECWVYASVVNAEMCIINKGWQSSSAYASYLIYITSGASLRFNSSSAGSSWDIANEKVIGTMTAGTWTHIAVTRSGTTFRAFVNGVINDSFTFTSSASLANIAAQTLFIGGRTDGSSSMNGYISNARIVNGTAVYTATFTPSTTPLTAITNTGLLTCQTTVPQTTSVFVDESGQNNSITRNGNTNIGTFSPLNGSWSNYFDGTGDYLDVPSNAAFTLGTGDFTIESWMYMNSVTTGTLYDSRTGVSSVSSTIYLNSGVLTYYVAGSNVITGATLASGQWYHVAVVRNSGSTKMYLNGTQTGSTYTDANNYVIGGPKIGAGYSNVNLLTGYISNLRVVKGTAVYTAAFTPSTTPLNSIANTSLLTCNSPSFVDYSPVNNVITKQGDTTVNKFSPFPGYITNFASYSGLFDGTGDYLSVPTNSALDFSTGDFTVEAWVYPNSIAADWFIISSSGSGGFFFGYSPGYGIGWGRTGVAWDYRSTGVGGTGTWQHMAVTRSGTSMKIFYNGTQVGTTQTLATAYNLGVTSTTIGSQGAAYYLNGYISNLRVVKGTAVYTANFTPSTTPLNSIANTSLLTCNSPSFVDYSPVNNVITRNGDTTVNKFSPFPGYITNFTSYSGYFDGTGDYLTTPSNSAFTLATGNFTIECWVYASGFGEGNAGTIFFISTGTVFLRYQNTTTWAFYDAGGVRHDYIFNSTNSGQNQWVHHAIVRNSGTTTWYINGASVYSGADTASYDGTIINIGQYTGAGLYWNGYISNFRVVKGTAVYTATFTPSTTPLTAIANTSLLTCQSTTFIDNSANAFAITVTGNTKPVIQNPFTNTFTSPVAYSPTTTGSSMYFDGTTDYLTTPASTANQMTGNFTVECWIYPTSIPAQAGLVGINNTASSGNANFGFYLETNRNITFWVAGNTTTYSSTNTPITIGAWQHVAFVRSGSTNTVYVNGVSVLTNSATPSWSGSPVMTIGRLFGDNTGVIFYGYISNVRIVKGTAVYTGPFVPSNSPLPAVQNTVLLVSSTITPPVYDAAELSDIENAGTAKLTASNSPYYSSYSGQFDGTGDYLSLPSNAAFQMGTGDFTLECWVNTQSSSAGGMTCIDLRNGQPSVSPLLYLVSGQVIYYVNGDAKISGATLNLFTWYHLAVVRSSSVTTLYVNGTASGSPYADTNNYILCGAVLGRFHDSDGGYLNGRLSNVRIVKGTAVYTSTFTPPTAPLTAISGTSLLTCQSNKFIDNSTNAFTVTKVGDTKISALQPFGGSNLTKYSSAYYGTKTDYLGIRPQPGLVTFPSDFTFECWVYPSDATLTTWGVWDSRQASTNANPMVIRLSPLASPVSGSYRMEYYNGTAYFGTTTIYTNQWTYLALVRSGTTMTFYVNGVAGGTATVSGTQTGALTSGLIYIGTKDGSISAYGNLGYIADFRITNGYARYTTTFTPPTVPLVGF